MTRRSGVDPDGASVLEVTAESARWAVSYLEERGARVHLGTSLVSAEDDHIVLSDGTEYDDHLLIWAAGNQSNPDVARHTDLPIDPPVSSRSAPTCTAGR
jgi:NADH dehydrogenase FAD-containing subunit